MEHCTENWIELNSRWDHCITVEDFLQCIPIRVGSAIIAVIGLSYGFVGVFLFSSMVIHYTDYVNLYINKKDLLIFLMIFCSIIAMVFFASIFLLWGVLAQKDAPIFVFLWIASIHILLMWLMTLSLCSYCAFSNINCFQGSGIGMIFISLLLTVGYTAIWIYIVITVNSFRMHG